MPKCRLGNVPEPLNSSLNQQIHSNYAIYRQVLYAVLMAISISTIHMDKQRGLEIREMMPFLQHTQSPVHLGL